MYLLQRSVMGSTESFKLSSYYCRIKFWPKSDVYRKFTGKHSDEGCGPAENKYMVFLNDERRVSPLCLREARAGSGLWSGGLLAPGVSLSPTAGAELT